MFSALEGLRYFCSDYEQQRLHLLHKHGIDLEDSMIMPDGKKTKRMSPKQVELLMGGGDGPGGIFTWREKHRRKVGRLSSFFHPMFRN
jgi:protein-serine/threonine kinase